MINVLIVDDERSVRKAFTADIEAASDRYHLVSAISSAGNAEAVVCTGKIDLILMDVNTANSESGIAAAVKIKKRYPRIRIIITTSYMDRRIIDQARSASIESVWFKDFSPDELIDVMDEIVNGGTYYPRKLPDIKIGETSINDFTPTEIQVLYLLLEYVSIHEIAEKMYVEDSTVKTHLMHMCMKAGCKNKTELAVLAAGSKLVMPRLKQ